MPRCLFLRILNPDSKPFLAIEQITETDCQIIVEMASTYWKNEIIQVSLLDENSKQFDFAVDCSVSVSVCFAQIKKAFKSKCD
jgi:hypothetical protein